MKGAVWDVDVFVVVDRAELNAVVEDVFSELRAFGQVYVGHCCALLERVVSKLHVFSEEYVDESPASLEGVMFENGFIGNIYCVDVRAPLEGVCADVFEVGGQKYACEVEASFECFFRDGFAG